MNAEKEYAQFQFFQPPALFANWFIFTLKTESSPPVYIQELWARLKTKSLDMNLNKIWVKKEMVVVTQVNKQSVRVG